MSAHSCRWMPVFAAVLLVGCAGSSSMRPAPPPPPPLSLQHADTLQIAAGCKLVRAQIVRVDYAVRTDGAVESARASGGSDCLGAGLERWVESFRYAPVAETVAATLEWMPALP